MNRHPPDMIMECADLSALCRSPRQIVAVEAVTSRDAMPLLFAGNEAQLDEISKFND